MDERDEASYVGLMFNNFTIILWAYKSMRPMS